MIFASHNNHNKNHKSQSKHNSGGRNVFGGLLWVIQAQMSTPGFPRQGYHYQKRRKDKTFVNTVFHPHECIFEQSDIDCDNSMCDRMRSIPDLYSLSANHGSKHA